MLQSGQQLITLVPSDAPLEVEANIAGQRRRLRACRRPVAIKFDTFPFTQYGMAHGTVRIISADSFTAQEEQRNPTGAVPVPNSGEPYYPGAHRHRQACSCTACPSGFHLMPGMPVTSDVKVGKRTVLTYLLAASCRSAWTRCVSHEARASACALPARVGPARVGRCFTGGSCSVMAGEAG